MKAWLSVLALSVCVSLSGCQAVMPKAQGIPTTLTSGKYTNAQAEVFWQDHSFAFLLSQEKSDDGWHIHALTLSGQVLFYAVFDGKTVNVVQKHSSLSALPVDFLMRDIWWATLAVDEVSEAIAPLGLLVVEQDNQRQIVEQDKVRLDVIQEQDRLSIQNPIVPYRLFLSQTEQSVLQ